MTLDAELSKLQEIVGVIDLPLEGKSVPSPDGTSVYVEGLAGGFGRDRVGDRFTAGALETALTDYMRNPVLLWAHNTTQALGEVIEARMVPQGLWIKARVDEPAPGTPILSDVWRKVKSGVISGLSIGGIFRRAPGGMITSMDMAEVSLAPIPANPETLCRVVGKAYTPDADMNTELARLGDLTTGPSPLDDALERLVAL